MKARTFIIFGGLAAVVLLWGEINGKGLSSMSPPAATAPSLTPRQEVDAVEACVTKGIAYFQSLGPKSWPRLTDGRVTVDVARERCRNTVQAFP